MFPSHSYEQYYQAVRRMYRFGQKRTVKVDIISTEGEHKVVANLQDKADRAAEMFRSLVAEMNNSGTLRSDYEFNQSEGMPSWL